VVGVILNLAVWFSIHALFAQVHEHRFFFGAVDVPDWQSINLAAVSLTLAAAVAVFRLRWNVLGVLGASAAVGIVLRTAGLA
jgi:chromate transporter